MTFRQAMDALKKAGTAQNRKVYARHGVGDEMFGVSFANLKKFAKQIKTNHVLARELWKSGNHDARVLALMVADADAMKSTDLDAWAKQVDNYVLADAFATHVLSHSKHAPSRIKAWTKRKDEWIARTGWQGLAALAMGERGLMGDAEFKAYIPLIEKGIHKAANRARDAMNGALIAIGTRSDALEKAAIAAAKRIGVVEVDHGETSCKTPEAAPYIKKARAHRKKKQAKARK